MSESNAARKPENHEELRDSLSRELVEPQVRQDIKKVLETPNPIMVKVRKLSVIQAHVADYISHNPHPHFHGLLSDIDRALAILVGAPHG